MYYSFYKAFYVQEYMFQEAQIIIPIFKNFSLLVERQSKNTQHRH